MTHNNELIIDLLRHGEPEGGQMIFRGRTDDPLTPLGWQQLEKRLGDHLPWDAIISSPARRCAEFAQSFATRHALTLALDEQLWELDFGEWEGQHLSDIHQATPELLADFWNHPSQVTPPGGEPLVQFQQRILGAWEQLQQQHQGKHLLVIAHSGSIRVIIGQILGMPIHALLKLELEYAGLSRVRVFYDEDQRVSGSSLVFHAGTLE